MENFTQYTPTEVIFGKGTEQETGHEVKKWQGHRVLIVYGGGSAKKSGLLDRIEQSLKEAGLAYEFFGGAKPNPTYRHAVLGVEAAAAMSADFILAVGGGSTIDTAKAIAHGAANPQVSLEDIWMKKVPLTASLPLGCVLTIPAAGSEMSDSAVLTFEERQMKCGINTPFNRCKFAIMNPQLVYTLPPKQLACGITDIMMHTMERYFIPGICCDFTDEIAEGLLRTMVKHGRIVMDKIDTYDSMAEVMWCGSISHNNLTECGRGKDFSVHKLGHALSAVFDVPHGASLAAVWGSWASYLYQENPQVTSRFAKYAEKVWGCDRSDDLTCAREGIEKTVDFFHTIGMPVNLKELEVLEDEKTLELLADKATMGDTVKLSRIRPLGKVQVKEIFQLAR